MQFQDISRQKLEKVIQKIHSLQAQVTEWSRPPGSEGPEKNAETIASPQDLLSEGEAAQETVVERA